MRRLIRLRSGHEVPSLVRLERQGEVDPVDDDGSRLTGTALRFEVEVDRFWYALAFAQKCFDEDIMRFGTQPLLWQHMDTSPIGTVDSLAVDGDRLRFEAGVLDDEWVPDAKKALALLRGKVLREVSAGVEILEWEEQHRGEDEVLRVTRARFRELSIVTFGAFGEAATVEAVGGERLRAARLRAEAARLTA